MRRTHLAIDAVGNRSAGGATVLLDVVTEALAHPRIGRVTCFASPRARRTFDLPADERLDEQPVWLADLSSVTRVLWHARLLGTRVAACGADLLLALNGMGDAPGIPTVHFVQQALPLLDDAFRIYPLHARVRLHALRTLTLHYLRNAAAAAVQTPGMADKLRGLLADTSVPIAHFLPSVTLPDAGPDLQSILPGGKADGFDQGSFLLYVGSARPHKCIDSLATAFAALHRRRPEVRLVTTLEPSHSLSELSGVRCVGYRTRAELRTLYENAALLVMPSLLETVGLPLLEAMIAGCPILAADRSYAHDVCGNAAHFFEPTTPEDLVRQATALLDSAPARQELVQRGHHHLTQVMGERPYRGLLDYALETTEASRDRESSR